MGKSLAGTGKRTAAGRWTVAIHAMTAVLCTSPAHAQDLSGLSSFQLSCKLAIGLVAIRVNRPLPVFSEGMGLDEIDADKRDDLKAWMDARVVRCEGYLARKVAWLEQLGSPRAG